MDNRYVGSQEQKDYLNFWKNAFKLNTIIPAIVDEFDVATQRVSATPAIQARYITPEMEVVYIDYPKITNIPLSIIKCPGLKLTCPVKKGQNCTLLFSQRSIDNFLIDGKIHPPFEGDFPQFSSLRCMDMTDALCFPGIITNPEAISNYNNDAIEIRNAAGTVKVAVSENDLQFIQGGAKIQMSGEAITVIGDVTQTGNLTMTGNISVTGDISATGNITAAKMTGELHSTNGFTGTKGALGSSRFVDGICVS